MRFGSIASETTRNIAAGTARVPLLTMLVAVIATLTAGVDLATIHGLQNQARSFISSGGATSILVAEDSVDAARCAALDEYRSVLAAGALRQADDLPLDALAGAGFPVYEVSTGFATLLGLAPATSGVWVARPLAESLGVEPGSTLVTQGRDVRVSGVFDYPDDGRDARLGYAIVMPTTDVGVFDECWMLAWPQHAQHDGILREGLADDAGIGTEMSLTQVNRSMGSTFRGAALFEERLTRWAPAVSGAVTALVGFAAVRSRRLEYASALHAGQSRGAMAATAVLEATVWCGLGGSLAGAALFLGAGMLAPEDISWMTSAILPSVSAGISGALIGVLAGTLTIRESALFRLFKER